MNEDESVCSECHHHFEIKTGELVKGWENVRVVTTGPLLCNGCKGAIINSLEKGLIP